jgi:thiosulfate dehydrogenase (quinone) large subunit
MLKPEKTLNYTNFQTFLLVALRMLIGWYFLYEGVTKIANPNWSSIGYLLDSKGMFSGMYHAMAASQSMITVIDWLNMWGLTLIGLGLILGLLTQLSLIFGILLLVLYYLSHPALASVTYALPQEGSYLWVNKTVTEIFAMAVLYVFPTGHIVGLDRLINKWIKK